MFDIAHEEPRRHRGKGTYFGDKRKLHPSDVWSLVANVVSVEFQQWLRAKEDKHRADEFVSRTCADFQFTRDGFGFEAHLWELAAKADGVSKGKAAYAHKKADMWRQKRDQVIMVYDASCREGVDSETLDHTRVSITPLEAGVALGLMISAANPPVLDSAHRGHHTMVLNHGSCADGIVVWADLGPSHLIPF